MVRDVVVIGGGVVGCAAAAMLADEDLRITLVEATAIGAGASGRNLGSVQHPYDEILEPLYERSVAAYRDLDGLDFPAKPAGLLLLARDAAGLSARTDALRAALPQLRPTFHERADRLESGVAEGMSACRLETGYPIPPGAATAAWAALAERRGVELRIESVAALRDGGVDVGGDRLSADAILVAAGPWTPALVDPSGGWLPIRRTWGVTVALELRGRAANIRHILEEEALDDEVAGATVRWSVPGEPRILFSLAVAGGGATLGSTFLPEEPEAEALAPSIVDRGVAFVPGLRDAPVKAIRKCARPQSVDGRPFIGPVPGHDTLFVCAGHGPWGISTGPASARMVVDAMLGAGTGIPPELSVARVPPPPEGHRAS